jgi:hypothetical protein
MSGDKEVAEFMEDHTRDVRDGLRCRNKGLKAMHLQSLRNRAEHREANQTQVAIERSQAQRDVKITLPKLKFLDEPENEL